MIKYLGSKRTLLPLLVETIQRLGDPASALDLFSGTSRVGHALKRAGLRVHASDHNAYAALLARCYVQADAEKQGRKAGKLIRELNALPGEAGWFTETYCERSRFFQSKNGARIDAIRESIAAKGLEPELEAVLLVSLMEAADRVDSTTGLQMAYLKQWAPRASRDLELRLPDLLARSPHGKGSAHQLDALDAAQALEADVAYLDPPYNQHKYVGNYHIWESLALWDRPEVYGVACKRMDCKERRSAFNSKRAAVEAMRGLTLAVRAKHLVVSFSDEGFINRADMEAMLAERGEVLVLEQDFRRYVGAQIGIHNPRGVKVGKVSHLRNTEYVFVASKDRRALASLRERFGVRESA